MQPKSHVLVNADERQRCRFHPRSPPKPRDSVRAEAPERVKASNDAVVPRQSLALVAQPSELPQLDLAQRRPTAEQKRHALITIIRRSAKLVLIEQQEVAWKVLDHLGSNLSAAPCAGAVRRFGWPLAKEAAQPLPDPRGQATRDLHQYLASAALGAVASEVKAKERLGRRNGSRSEFIGPRSAAAPS